MNELDEQEVNIIIESGLDHDQRFYVEFEHVSYELQISSVSFTSASI